VETFPKSASMMGMWQWASGPVEEKEAGCQVAGAGGAGAWKKKAAEGVRNARWRRVHAACLSHRRAAVSPWSRLSHLDSKIAR